MQTLSDLVQGAQQMLRDPAFWEAHQEQQRQALEGQAEAEREKALRRAMPKCRLSECPECADWKRSTEGYSADHWDNLQSWFGEKLTPCANGPHAKNL